MSEKQQFDMFQHRTESQASLVLWWSVTGFVAFACMVLALASGRSIRVFDELFRGLQVDLPWPTSFLLATYHWLLPALYLGLALSAVLIQFSSWDFRAKRLATVRIFLAAIVSMGLIVFVLYLPLLTIASKLSH